MHASAQFEPDHFLGPRILTIVLMGSAQARIDQGRSNTASPLATLEQAEKRIGRVTGIRLADQRTGHQGRIQVD